MNSPSYFEIQADNPEKVASFYQAVFGWKFAKDPNIPIDYWRIETEGLRGGLLKRPAPAPAPRSGTNAFACSMEVKDFEAVAKTISDNGGMVAMPKFAVVGVCWQGYFLDPEGNVFGLYQPDPGAK